jgi:hypothetical protein
MSDPTLDIEPGAPVGVTAESFDLMDWIESGTVGRREVTIHNDPALYAEFQAIQAERDAVKAALDAAGGERTLDDVDPFADLDGRESDLADRWEASKAVWTVRALSSDEIEATFETVPQPKIPVQPPIKPSTPDKVAAAMNEQWVEQVAAWQKAVKEADRERTLHIVAAAVVSVQTARGTVDRVSVDAIRALRDRPHGEQWVGVIRSDGKRASGRLAEAVEAATEADVPIPRPTLPGPSTNTKG